VEGADSVADTAPGLDTIYSVVVPRADVTIIDDWPVAGLKGTGWMSFSIDGLEVPDRRTFQFPGLATIPDPMYRPPLFSLASPGDAAVAA
jgi:hypothetical protein